MKPRPDKYCTTASKSKSATLTSREKQVVRLVVRGLSNKAIGRRLSISEGTVKIHLHNIYVKLNIPNRLALAEHARTKRMI